MIKLWMPLNKDLRNTGLVYTTPTGGGEVVDDSTFGKVFHTSSGSAVNTGLEGPDWDWMSGNIGFGGWFKFNLNELRSVSSYTYNSTNNLIHNVVVGFGQYGGYSIDLQTNNIYSDGKVNSATLQVHIRNGQASNQTVAKAIVFDEWHHYYTQYINAKKKLCFYYDGDLVSSATTSNVPHSAFTRNFMINNATVWGGNAPAKWIPYYVHDVRLYGHELKDSEIKELASSKVFDVRGCSMTTKVVNDLGGTGTILTPKNAVKSGNTFYFNGTNAYIITSELDFMKMADSNYTFSMWINSNEADSSRSIYFGCGNQGNGWTLAFEKQANTNKFRIYNNAKPDWYVDGCVMTPNQWIHIAVTKSGDTFKVYKNGVVVGTKTGVSAHTAFDKIYYLGSDYRAGDTMFKGYIGDFKAYATALSDDEIAKIYAKNFPKEHESNGYVPIKCLRFTGQQYLNIGKLSATNSIKVELDFLPENEVFNQPTFLGVSGKSIQFYRASSGTAVSVWTSGKSCKFGDVVYGQVNNLVFTSTASNLKHSWNGGTESNFSNTVYFGLLKGGDMLIGAYSPGTNYPFHGDIYSMRVYCDDVLRNDLISAVNSSGSVGFYDKKDGNWYFSQTSTDFEIIL